METSEFLSAAEACRELGIGRRTLDRYVKRGLIAAVTHAGRLYISRKAIADYWGRLEVDAQRQRAKAEKAGRRA